MKVLARIPALDAIDAAAIRSADMVEVDASTPGAVGAQGPVPGLRRRPARRPRGRFPTASIAALAVLATVAWSLASWNDACRAERSRQERLARLQPAVSSSGTISR